MATVKHHLRFSALSRVILVGVIGMFSVVGVKVLQSSQAATTIVDCSTPINTFSYRAVTKPDVFIGNPRLGFTSVRSYPLGTTVKPGKYDIYAIASDDHFRHRSSAPDKDVQVQKEERFYVKLAGQRTPNATSDFTDFYDWHTGEGNYQDDDNNIITIPPQVADDKGEFIGSITTTTATDTITFEHFNIYGGSDNSPNSVIPYAIGITCTETVIKDPKLEVVKKVDANSDGQFNDNSEQASLTQPVKWHVEGKNVGEGNDSAAVISDCIPQGLTYTDGSLSQLSGPAGAISYNASTRCITWTGPLAAGQTVILEYATTVTSKANFNTCDAADGTVNGVCIYDATIGSTRTGTLVIEDRDPAGITLAESVLSVSKKVSLDNATYAQNMQFGQANYAGSVYWKIAAKNTGNGNEPAARIVDTFPAGVVIESATAEGSGNQPTVTGQKVVWNGAIGAGQTVTLVVKTKVADLAAFTACDNASGYPNNQLNDQKCPNLVTLGVAGNGTDDFVSGTTKTDNAYIYGDFAAALVMDKMVDGSDNDETTAVRFTEREMITAATKFTWKLHLYNSGDADATNVVLTDKMPAGVAIAPSQAVRQTVVDATGQFQVTGDTVSWTGTIKPGGSVDLEIDAIVADLAAYTSCQTASSSQDCINVARATATSSVSGQQLSTQASANVYAVFAPDLQISKSVDGNGDSTFSESFEEVEENTNFFWMIKAQNNGNAPAINARVIDPIPDGLELIDTDSVELSEPNGGSTTKSLETITLPNGQKAVVWTGDLPVGASVNIAITNKVVNKAAYEECQADTPGDRCRDTATLGIAGGDNKTLDTTKPQDSDDAEVSLILKGRLAVSKDVDGNGDDVFNDEELIEPGRKFYWRFTVSNTGDAAINNAAAYDVLPQGVVIDGTPELISEAVADDTVEVISGTRMAVFWHAPKLQPNQSAQVVIPVKIADKAAFDSCDNDEVDGDADGICTNPVTAGTGEDPEGYDPDTDPETSGVKLLLAPELVLQKEVDASDADTDFTKQEQHKSGQAPVVWRVSLSNTSATAATKASIKDILPRGFQFSSMTITPNDSAEPTFDETTNTVNWDGRVDGNSAVVIMISGRVNTDEDFATCDAADTETDSLCTNVATAQYEYMTIDSATPKTKDLSSSAAISNVPGAPDLKLEKAVDANNDGSFAPEEDYVIGDTITWAVVATNDGDGSAKNLRISDEIRDGMQYVENTANFSLTVPSGAVRNGAITVRDGAVAWEGDLPAGATVRVYFRTVVKTLQAFGNCNFADGNVKDERCTNTANLHLNQDSTPFLTASAKLKTKLQVVLAATGSRDTIVQVLVGVAIALTAVGIAVSSLRASNVSKARNATTAGKA